MTMYNIPAFLIVECFTRDQLVEQDNGEYVLTVGARPDIHRQPTDEEPKGPPSQAGDVLSIQTDGSAQTRPAGTNGNFERCVKGAGGLVYRPVGVDGRAFFVPCQWDAPNKS